MEKKKDKWRKARSLKVVDRLDRIVCTLEKIRFGDVECGKLLHYKIIQRHNTQT
ncbi:hypothetical protein T05_2843 [Trichinella murrelli]|uniref:Uncharacterized protein n=1 Tax=Trichinella murrelli TaxID=144512 RepID=A0A0V0SRG7_9BILA|nr:hypothetical protein T05_2843 [Trichinella murrelli]